MVNHLELPRVELSIGHDRIHNAVLSLSERLLRAKSLVHLVKNSEIIAPHSTLLLADSKQFEVFEFTLHERVRSWIVLAFKQFGQTSLHRDLTWIRKDKLLGFIFLLELRQQALLEFYLVKNLNLLGLAQVLI